MPIDAPRLTRSFVTMPGDHEAWGQLSSALDAVLRNAETLGLVSTNEMPADARTMQQGALMRLVRGAQLAGDEAMLEVPVKDSRLLCIVGSTSAAADRIVAKLQGNGALAICRMSPDVVALLVRNSPRRAGEDRALSTAHVIARTVLSIDVDARMAISSSIASAADIASASADAHETACLGQPGEIVNAERRWATLALVRLQRNRASWLGCSTPVHRLLEHDARHGTEFTRTLRVWLRTNQDSRTSATELCIHPNTLRYRVRRACTLVDLDLEDPGQRLITQLLLS